MRKRLYLQVYLSFVLILVLFCCAAMGWGWTMRGDADTPPPFFSGTVGLVGDRLPPPGGPIKELRRSLETEADRLGVLATLWDREGRLLASVGDPLRASLGADARSAWIRSHRGPPGVIVRLADGRRLGLAMRRHPRHHMNRMLLGFVLLAAVIAVGAYPLSRRITGRIERLRAGVDRLGAGDLQARVPVEGCDEVADLAISFNEAAARVERLVVAQKRVLASASHEFRSPLARLRMAVELMSTDQPADLKREATADIAELDALVEDVLLGARLEAGESPGTIESVDLLALVVEEGARVRADVSGQPTTIHGNVRSLRRLVRNLLENAVRYGEGSVVEASVATRPNGGARITVCDRGPGVAAEERERIFDPFYRPSDHSEGHDGSVGLGLALVREIARHHGGDARCLQREGGGTELQIDLAGTPPTK